MARRKRIDEARTVDEDDVLWQGLRRAVLSSRAYALWTDRAGPDAAWWERWDERHRGAGTPAERVTRYREALDRAGIDAAVVERHVEAARRLAERMVNRRPGGGAQHEGAGR